MSCINDKCCCYRVSVIKKPKYRPYTWEDRDLLRDKWIRRKDTHNEYIVVGLRYSAIWNDWIDLTGHYVSPDTLLKSYESLDGSPCGVKE